MTDEIELFQIHPHLTIVGTFHGLNGQDKITLNDIVKGCKFVGLEWDEIRDGGEPYLRLRPFRKTRLINDCIYAGWNDYMFLRDIKKNNRKSIRKRCKESGRVCDFKTSKGNEFLYVKELCEQQGIDYYFVDDLTTHTLMSVLQRNIMNYKGMRVEIIDQDFNGRNRSERMLSRLIKHVGPLDNLQVDGALVVGYSHLEYYKKIQL